MENSTFITRPWRTSPNHDRSTSMRVGAFLAWAAVAAAFCVQSAAVPTKKRMATPTHRHSLRARTT